MTWQSTISSKCASFIRRSERQLIVFRSYTVCDWGPLEGRDLITRSFVVALPSPFVAAHFSSTYCLFVCSKNALHASCGLRRGFRRAVIMQMVLYDGRYISSFGGNRCICCGNYVQSANLFMQWHMVWFRWSLQVTALRVKDRLIVFYILYDSSLWVTICLFYGCPEIVICSFETFCLTFGFPIETWERINFPYPCIYLNRKVSKGMKRLTIELSFV